MGSKLCSNKTTDSVENLNNNEYNTNEKYNKFINKFNIEKNNEILNENNKINNMNMNDINNLKSSLYEDETPINIYNKNNENNNSFKNEINNLSDNFEIDNSNINIKEKKIIFNNNKSNFSGFSYSREDFQEQNNNDNSFLKNEFKNNSFYNFYNYKNNNNIIINNINHKYFNIDYIIKKIKLKNDKVIDIYIINNINKIINFYHKLKNKIIGYTNQSLNNIPINLNFTLSKSSKIILDKNINSFGIKKYQNNSIYYGTIINNKCNGIGKFLNSEHKIIKGEFKNDFLDGFCIIESNENKFYGISQKNILNGIVIEKYIDNSVFEGEYLNNEKYGIGTYKWKNGNKYIGDFKNNKMEGYGVFYYQDGRIYEGEWINNKMNGIGIFKWKDGRKYFGKFFEDKRNGFGIFLWKNPFKIYIGEWKNNSINGIGKLITNNKEIFALWENSKGKKKYNNLKFFEKIKKNENIKFYEKYYTLKIEDILNIMNSI